MKLISACLLGIRCNWKGDESYLDHKVLALAGEGLLLPVCPEQVGGLPTPRSPQEIPVSYTHLTLPTNREV